MKFKLKIFVFVLFCCFVISCNNDSNRSSIPIAPVQVRINLLHFPHLSAMPGTQYFTEANPAIGVWNVGYGGVLISTFMDLSSPNVLHAAFDMACPYEMNRNIRVFPEGEDGRFAAFAVCEACGSRFNLIDGLGMLMEGPATEGLRRFNTFRDGTFLRVVQRYDL